LAWPVRARSWRRERVTSEAAGRCGTPGKGRETGAVTEEVAMEVGDEAVRTRVEGGG
jgi:hypothetical protein